MRARVLVVDDDVSMGDMLRAGLGKRGLDVVGVADASAAMGQLAAGPFDVVVTDLNLRQETGLDLCIQIAERYPDVPVVVITAFGSIESAVSAMRAGAYDFIPKPFEIDALKLTLDRALQHRALSQEVRRLRRVVSAGQRLDDLVGQSTALQKLTDLLDRVTGSESTVLVTGESGTGKELIARALHKRSPRSGGPFVAVDCASLPEHLLESELFGHARGAFTDAHAARTGLFVEASGGTLFLDEIGELPPGLQPKLLRALQERRVRPVGSNAEVPIDVRVVAATNRDLESAVGERAFREDLYYRLNVIHVQVPPLRQRGNDVLLLAQHFLEALQSGPDKRVRGFSTKAAARLLGYSWPGNVRELRNCVERALALARYSEITVDELPDRVRDPKPAETAAAPDPSSMATLAEVERRHILHVLEAVSGNKTLAAQVLGLDRTTLYRKLDRFSPSGS
jgi:two-component system response regulator HydG